MADKRVPYLTIGSLTYDYPTVNMLRDAVISIRDRLMTEDRMDEGLALTHTAVVLKAVLERLDEPKGKS